MIYGKKELKNNKELEEHLDGFFSWALKEEKKHE